MKRFRCLGCLAAVLALAGGADAALFNYNFPLSGLQEVPPNASPAVGTGLVTLNTDTNMLSWDISFGGLLAPVSASHFHAPALPGVNAGVVLPIAGAGAISPIIGQSVISDLFESQILGGLSYVNVHSTMFPGGEIRGQVVPEPTMLSLMALGGLLLVRRRRG